jgi:ATP-dependent Lon protease
MVTLLETDSTVTEKKKMQKIMKSEREYYLFEDLCKTGREALNRKDYAQAADAYCRAFEMDQLRATHMHRFRSLAAFAQTGRIDEAFEQIELLANWFELQGNEALTEDPLLAPLHSDKRWDKFMKILDKNAEKARQDEKH